MCYPKVLVGMWKNFVLEIWLILAPLSKRLPTPGLQSFSLGLGGQQGMALLLPFTKVPLAQDVHAARQQSGSQTFKCSLMYY